jgi:hypothetical protein
MGDSEVGTYKLNSRPYGPEGIAFKPNLWKRMIALEEIMVDTRDDINTNDYHDIRISLNNRITTRTAYFRAPKDLSFSQLGSSPPQRHNPTHRSIATPTLYSSISPTRSSVELANAKGCMSTLQYYLP